MTSAAGATQTDNTAVKVRPATIADIDALVQLRTLLFDDAGSDSDGADVVWQGACRQLLIDGFSVGDLLGAVAETADGTIVAGGIAALRRWLPSPTNPTGLTGYIDSLTTSEPWRRQGIGHQVVESLIEALTQRGAITIQLHATEAGEATYRRLGFVDHQPGIGLTLHTPDRQP